MWFPSSLVAAYGSSPSAWSKGRQPSGAVLHSSHELGELSLVQLFLEHPVYVLVLLMGLLM